MAIEFAPINKDGMSKQIADAIRIAILQGKLVVDERLPSENELAQRYGVSRPTVREALKRLAAQNLIRTRRGSGGGVFINRLSWTEAHEALLTISTLLLGMNEIPIETVTEARYALEMACLPLACHRADQQQLSIMHSEIERQKRSKLSDEDFCASDVRFHRALVDSAGNPVLSFQMVGVIEAVQPLMNMVTYRHRDRARITELHASLVQALENRDLEQASSTLKLLASYTTELTALMRTKAER